MNPEQELTDVEGAPGDVTTAVLGLREGGTALVVEGEPTAAQTAAREVASGGVIYAGDDMPSLEDILEQLNVITAVIERPAPQIAGGTTDTGRDVRRRAHRGLRTTDVFVLGGLPVGFAVAGTLLLIAGVASEPITPNPYLGLFLAVAGLILGITGVMALRDSGRS